MVREGETTVGSSTQSKQHRHKQTRKQCIAYVVEAVDFVLGNLQLVSEKPHHRLQLARLRHAAAPGPAASAALPFAVTAAMTTPTPAAATARRVSRGRARRRTAHAPTAATATLFCVKGWMGGWDGRVTSEKKEVHSIRKMILTASGSRPQDRRDRDETRVGPRGNVGVGATPSTLALVDRRHVSEVLRTGTS